MKINDRVYGEFEIKEQVLIELINSKAIQRLKDVTQQGVPQKYNPQPYFSRYEHSIGVMLLLRKLGADLNEQIAGLLHDMSHPAFSHLIDWVVGDPKVQEHQDSNFLNVLKNSEVPIILERNGFEASDFYDLDKYSLLESSAPDLCADRVDYTLRDLVAHGGKTVSDRIMEHLVVRDKSIHFDSVNVAHAFAQEYKALQFHSWGSDRNNSMFEIFSNILKEAFAENLIKKEDLFDGESGILVKLENSNNEKILSLLKMLKEGFKVFYLNEGFEIKCKFRFIDPRIVNGDNVNKLSELVPSYKYQLELHKEHFESKRFAEVSLR